MNLTKNVLNNNMMRAYLVDCCNLKLVENPNAQKKEARNIFSWILDEHKPALLDFVKTHQSTCAVYELVLTTILIEVLYFCVFTCPRCGKQLKVEVGG